MARILWDLLQCLGMEYSLPCQRLASHRTVRLWIRLFHGSGLLRLHGASNDLRTISPYPWTYRRVQCDLLPKPLLLLKPGQVRLPVQYEDEHHHGDLGRIRMVVVVPDEPQEKDLRLEGTHFPSPRRLLINSGGQRLSAVVLHIRCTFPVALVHRPPDHPVLQLCDRRLH